MRRPVRWVAIVVPLLASACESSRLVAPERVERPFGVDRLLDGLVDLDWLATPPPAGERSIQFSSYDRASEKGRGDPEAWFANGDCGVFLREEKGGPDGERPEWVMADVDGPGAVVRIWSANPSGELRFYFNGESEASYTVSFRDLCGGAKAPFVEPLCGVHSSGWNCYVPFPFANHLKLTATTHDFYYHVNVRRFAAGTAVTTFTPADLGSPSFAQFAARIDRATRPPDPAALPPTAIRAAWPVVLASGESDDVECAGPATLRWLAAHVDAADLRAALRDLRLTIAFDGEEHPSVDAPLGDLFGTAPDFTSYATALLGVTADGTGWCRFPMPFARSLHLRVTNEGGAPATVRLTLVRETAPLNTPSPLPPLRFHAKWRQARDLKTQPRSDYVVLDADGPGRFVGGALMVRNPVKAWWGEGDEHAWVDDETFPSTFGTGSEDYFGYAWCDPHPFQAAFHSQSRCDGPANRGYTSVNRFEIGESIPFAKRLRFELEVWHWASCAVDYASMAYWYAPAGSSDRFEPMGGAAGRHATAVAPLAGRFPDAIEAERLIDRAKASGGRLQTQEMTGFGNSWSVDEQLWWTGGKPGDRLDLPLTVETAGDYAVHVQFTKAADYGIVAAALDGAPIGPEIDLYHAGVVASGDLVLGTMQLAAGAHTLSFTLRGANAAAIPAHMVGIDYVRLVR